MSEQDQQIVAGCIVTAANILRAAAPGCRVHAANIDLPDGTPCSLVFVFDADLRARINAVIEAARKEAT
jgi:hypothetical protein